VKHSQFVKTMCFVTMLELRDTGILGNETVQKLCPVKCIFLKENSSMLFIPRHLNKVNSATVALFHFESFTFNSTTIDLFQFDSQALGGFKVVSQTQAYRFAEKPRSMSPVELQSKFHFFLTDLND